MAPTMTTDHFAAKASTYENPERTDNVRQIADGIRARFTLEPSMQIMDFGSGTGLLLENLAPHVGRITAVDVSPAMIAQLRPKLDRLPCPVEILEIDLATASLEAEFDGIVSSMTLHHVQDVDALLAKLHALLKGGGFLAIADLDREDGTFHTGEDTGVHHHGFARADLAHRAAAAGYREIAIDTVGAWRKNGRDYPVLLLTARR
jgi:2-polyprenyl-3-methyl-5-hydroxy-6-metoxy-1,4-benzoquinol methylase